MFLILSNDRDETALAVWKEICARHGADAAVLLTDKDLMAGVGWSHRQQGDSIQTRLSLPDGRRIDSDQIAGVFNRLRYLNPACFTLAAAGDREYALGEMFALLLSWLASLPCTVINPTSVRGLGGDNRSLLGWLKLAGEAGMPTRGARFTTNARLVSQRNFSAFQPPAGASLALAAHFTPVSPTLTGQGPTLFLESVGEEIEKLVVVGDLVLGEPREMADAARALARMSNTPLLECVFVRSAVSPGDVWRCGWVNPFPQLSGEEVAAVVNLLEADISL